MTDGPRTLFDKVWDAHVVAHEPGSPAVLYVDLHLVHEVTSAPAFATLNARGLVVRRPERTAATMDHITPTSPDSALDDVARDTLSTLEKNCAEHGVRLFAMGDARRGIVHVIGPELGLSQPGMTIVCGDSHTSTHGAVGALAFGIGTSEVGHVLATQCLLQRRPEPMEIRVDGQLPAGVTAKDIILRVVAELGIGGGTGAVFEYRGAAIEALDMEGRMTLCNMSIEAGARAGMVAPDETTFAWLRGRDFAPSGAAWDRAVARWRELRTDDGATFARRLVIDAATLEPMITWGTNPGMGIGITEAIPNPDDAPDASTRAALQKALDYMHLEAGAPLLGQPVDVVFVGSCTNSRLSDLRAAAAVLDGRQVAPAVRMLVVPGSERIKAAAEAEGLHHIIVAAGAEWHEPGCSLCIAMNGDTVAAGKVAVSTSNRNFEGRQGPGSRTFLASPATAAACAVTGRVTDPRTLSR
ncbi:MAG: 3-isopropylmalate dehydratase large subunit [Deltaproteobacteria bacterium HGW-Deltaproteobacteria-14]|jgi:3-isopropylmalate/(R)-2-methylmalate dehydratase large subunit|nr:MAG: 3-isopropylmalate dehydratase large subunit [Deltaproteobacteria bacterium HGW-Deltaproteobacteria-14]